MRLDMYEEVETIFRSEEKDIILVRHAISNTLFIKKIIFNSNDADIYETLKEHTHPNIATVYEVERQNQHVQLIEEYINGVTLEYAISTHDFTCDEIVSVMMQLLDAVEFLHHFHPPIIHRDLKPANIMLFDKRVKLIDFEIARLYKQEQLNDTRVVGSPGFAAPEQYGFHQSDERSDIYALGIILKCLCEHATQPNLMADKLFSIIKCCMELDPLNRYQNICEMRKAFGHIKSKKEHAIDKRAKQTFFIPGFAKESIGERICIYIYYACAAIIVLNIEVKGASSIYAEIILKIAILLNLLSYLWIPKNVGGILKMLPLHRSSNPFIRILNGILIYIILLFFLLILMALSNSIIESML